MKKCKTCLAEKEESSFQEYKPGLRRKSCYTCINLKIKQRDKTSAGRQAISRRVKGILKGGPYCCTECDKTKPAGEYSIDNRGYRVKKCNKCSNKRNLDPKRMKMQRNRDKRRRLDTVYIEKKRAIQNIFAAEQRKNLGDWYILQILNRGLRVRRNDIPASLIEAKRLHLLLTRELKGTKNEKYN